MSQKSITAAQLLQQTVTAQKPPPLLEGVMRKQPASSTYIDGAVERGGGVLLVRHHMCTVTQMGGFRTLCSLLPASSSCRSLAFNSSLVLCLICSWRSADSCSLSSFMAEILDFSSRTTRSVSCRKEDKIKDPGRKFLIQEETQQHTSCSVTTHPSVYLSRTHNVTTVG